MTNPIHANKEVKNIFVLCESITLGFGNNTILTAEKNVSINFIKTNKKFV